MKISILGARGIPARYSGYDTLTEEVAVRLAAQGHQVRVYCRSGWYRERPRFYQGVELVYLPAPKLKGVESLLHSFLSAMHLLLTCRGGIVYFLDPANAPFVCLLRLFRRKVVVHTDGLGWQRRKWGALARRYYRWVEGVCARFATALVADNPCMVEYYQSVYGVKPVEISYGAEVGNGANGEALAELGLEANGYLLVVARLEPENNTDIIITEYVAAQLAMPLVIVGSAPYAAEYFRRLQSLANQQVIFAGRVEDQARLNGLMAGCAIYLHGHQVGGTNPSLLRAMHAAVPIVAIKVNFNQAVLAECGFYFTPEKGNLATCLQKLAGNPETGRQKSKEAAQRVSEHFRWDQVTAKHQDLFAELIK